MTHFTSNSVLRLAPIVRQQSWTGYLPPHAPRPLLRLQPLGLRERRSASEVVNPLLYALCAFSGHSKKQTSFPPRRRVKLTFLIPAPALPEGASHPGLCAFALLL